MDWLSQVREAPQQELDALWREFTRALKRIIEDERINTWLTALYADTPDKDREAALRWIARDLVRPPRAETKLGKALDKYAAEHEKSRTECWTMIVLRAVVMALDTAPRRMRDNYGPLGKVSLWELTPYQSYRIVQRRIWQIIWEDLMPQPSMPTRRRLSISEEDDAHIVKKRDRVNPRPERPAWKESFSPLEMLEAQQRGREILKLATPREREYIEHRLNEGEDADIPTLMGIPPTSSTARVIPFQLRKKISPR